MAHNRSKTKSRSDAGGYAALYRHVARHPDYQNLSGNAVKLLMDLALQYNGRNNGDLTAAFSVVGQRVRLSKTSIRKFTSELLEAGLIVCTREGRFINPGGVCALYALTWKPIDECSGKQLTVGPTSTPRRKFSLENNEMTEPQRGLGSGHNVDRQKARDSKGKYLSGQSVDRLRVVT
jgi:hypothetical protein